MLTFCFAYSYKDASKTAGLCHKKSFNLNQILDKGQASKMSMQQVQAALVYRNLDGLERKDFLTVIPAQSIREREMYLFVKLSLVR